ncbi:hypothetical protein GGQ74_000834 [Desulfobaculum xiamenense]|uniref:AB hydrolase-1 domain-containing protein n=1 Tax=Desulfobaculum xiamenense TaxID=995050 RepID=A0A846QPQ2_9BACT|nr:alpha/beta fold hydrolase [Desulfobaculum xiamenense]NJB67194.1 hypothetical protein [Desulfobaculum xiamenense]
MKRLLLLTLYVCLALFPQAMASAADDGYGYPFDDPYVSTVVGTPGELMHVPAARVMPLRHFLRVDTREVPDLFWHSRSLRYSAALQSGRAPLIFLIAGTGAGYNSQKLAYLQQVFYAAGYHAVCVSSPTHPNFIVSASTSRAPGYIVDDTEDLYRVLRLIDEDLDLGDRVEGYYLSGYSLGGAQAAFLARLDEERGAFGFRRVLMLNPPVSLYDSALRLDALLDDAAASGESTEETVSRLVGVVSEYYSSREKVDFGGDFLYRLYNYRPVPEKDLRVLVGVSFRMSSANIIFATDVCLGTGYIVPRGVQLEPSDPLRSYLLAAVKLDFRDYFDEFLAPYLHHRDPSLTAEEIIRRSSLESIADYLADSDKIYMATNADDPILSGTDVEFLRRTFGSRAIIYPRGGHCGNIMYSENVADMLAIMAGKEVRR